MKKLIPEKIKGLLLDIARDPEFLYDFNLGGNTGENFDFIVNNSGCLKVCLTGLKNDYEDDIEAETESGEDATYLLETYEAIKTLLNQL